MRFYMNDILLLLIILIITCSINYFTEGLQTFIIYFFGMVIIYLNDLRNTQTNNGATNETK